MGAADLASSLEEKDLKKDKRRQKDDRRKLKITRRINKKIEKNQMSFMMNFYDENDGF